MVPAALMLLNHNNDRESMSNQCPQPTTHSPRRDSYPVFFSLGTMDSKSKGLRVSLAFFQRNYLPDGRVNGTVATVKELSDYWKPGAMGGNSAVWDELCLYLSAAVSFSCLFSFVCRCKICFF